MPTPGGPISLDDLWQEPNPGWSAQESFSDITYNSWEQGPLGSNINIYNGWGNDGSGFGAPIGANVIYNVGGGLTQSIDSINFDNYTNKYYYFDGTVFNIQYQWNNTLANVPVPPPGVDNNVTVQVDCYDYNGVYTVHNSFAIAANASTSGGPNPIPGSITSSPLVENVYWSINVSAAPTNTISNIAFNINGINRINTGPVGAGSTLFTWTSVGASAGLTNSSGILYDVVVT
jgi:hypothetical protein